VNSGSAKSVATLTRFGDEGKVNLIPSVQFAATSPLSEEDLGHLPAMW
jgi:hypothetical protein